MNNLHMELNRETEKERKGKNIRSKEDENLNCCCLFQAKKQKLTKNVPAIETRNNSLKNAVKGCG